MLSQWRIHGLDDFWAHWPHPVRRGRLDPALRQQLPDWVLSFGVLDDRAAARLAASDVPLLVAGAWPDADPEQAFGIAALTAVFDAWDAAIGEEPPAARGTLAAEALESLSNGFSGTGGRWEPIHRAVWERCARGMGPRVRHRFALCLQSYIEDRRRPGLRGGARAGVDAVLVEYAVGAELEEGSHGDPALRRLRAAHLRLAGLIREWTGVAADRAARVRGAIAEFDDARHALLCVPGGLPDELRAYIDGLRDWTSGFVCWTESSYALP